MVRRAISTYARCYVPLFVILAPVAIALGIVGAFISPGFAHAIDALNTLVTLAPADAAGRARVLAELNRYATPSGWVVLYYLSLFTIYPLPRTAAIAFAAGTLDGAAPSVNDALRRGLSRWTAQIVAGLGFIALALALSVAFAFLSALALMLLAAAGAASSAAVPVAGGVLGFALVALLIAAAAVLYFAWLLACVGVAVEDERASSAIARALARTFDPQLRRRTFAVALAVLAFDWFGGLAIGVLAGAFAALTHTFLAAAVVATCAGVALEGVRTIFIVLYARDIALRREGADLLAAAAAPDDGGDDRTLIARYLERRATLEPRASAELAARIAARVRPKLRASFHYLDDEALLEHVARSD